MCGLDQGFNKIIALAYLTTGRKAWQPHFCFNGDVCVREVISLPKDYCNNNLLSQILFFMFKYT